jgi:hypothetical protein
MGVARQGSELWDKLAPSIMFLIISDLLYGTTPPATHVSRTKSARGQKGVEAEVATRGSFEREVLYVTGWALEGGWASPGRAGARSTVGQINQPRRSVAPHSGGSGERIRHHSHVEWTSRWRVGLHATRGNPAREKDGTVRRWTLGRTRGRANEQRRWAWRLRRIGHDRTGWRARYRLRERLRDGEILQGFHGLAAEARGAVQCAKSGG